MLLRKKALPIVIPLLVLSLIIVGSFVISPEPAGADVVPAEISSYKISPKPDNELIVGVDYQIEFTLTIATGVEGNIVLETQMEKSGTNYWDLLTSDYEGVPSSWQPGQKNISFDAAPGTPTFVLTGYVPENMTTTVLQTPFSGTMTLHRPGTLSILSLSLDSGDTLEGLSVFAIDDSLLRYNDALDKKHKALSENSDLKKVVEELAEGGYTDQAMAILDTLPSEGWDSDSGASTAILYMVLAVMAVIAVIAIIFLLRGRGTTAFLKQRSSDQADKLDIVEARAQKLGERSLTSEIAQIRDTLREMGRR